MLMFLNIRKNTSLLAKLIETAQGFFERFIVPDPNTGHSDHPFQIDFLYIFPRIS
ncbi:hypothetical protein TRIP_C21065 [Candidatus Zixiibacteriota bacterium]|nr:hypothetical protein TRIP_C21065 [candidate division Zixibacteria bacterium]